MEKKSKKTHSSGPGKIALVSGSTEQKVKVVDDQQQKDKESNHPNRPHMLFK